MNIDIELNLLTDEQKSPLSQESRRLIQEAVDNPSPETWEAAKDLVIRYRPRLTLDNAAFIVTHPGQQGAHFQGVPDQATILEAVRFVAFRTHDRTGSP